MASTATLAPYQAQSGTPDIQLSQQGATSNRSDSRGGRGGSRSGHSHERHRGGRRGRGQRGNRGDGRGDPIERRQSNAENQPLPPKPPPPGLGGGGTSGGRPTGAAETEKGEVGQKPPVEREEDLEAEVCFICASPVIHNAVGPCNHRTCHICALRLRALYKTRACAHCRVRSPRYASH